MEIRNLMEGLVEQTIDQMCSETDESGKALYCTDDECRFDAACYVLNRLAPRYAGTSRGIARLTRELQQDSQLQIDILRLVSEALQRVTSVQRSHSVQTRGPHEVTACYNFPTIRGRILNGTTFAPISDITVELFLENESAQMGDNRWQNPYTVSEYTPGTYLFWPESIATERPMEERTFSFELRVTDGAYDPFRHLFRIDLRSDDHELLSPSLHREFLLPDLYLFPR